MTRMKILMVLMAAFVINGCGADVTANNPQSKSATPAVEHKALSFTDTRTRDHRFEILTDGVWEDVGYYKQVTCTVGAGCMSVDNSGALDTIQLGLVEIDTECPLDADSQGPCGPIGVSVNCTGDNCDAVKDGEAYTDRWLCLAKLVDGVCKTTPVAFPCPDGEVAEMSGVYPFYSLCNTPVDCDDNEDCVDDGNPCTAEICTAEGTCASTVVPDAPCDDADACTTDDACQIDATCAGRVNECDDQNECTSDSCDPTDGSCVNDGAAQDGEVCSDGVDCTFDNICAAGACVGTPNHLSCSDGVSCTQDECTVAGCTNTASDSLCADGNVCTTATCDAVDDCQVVNVPDTTVCDDGSACTEGTDQCLNGVCGGPEKDCDDQNDCTIDSCDPVTGECAHMPEADSVFCSDDELWVCVNGGCTDKALTCDTDDLHSCNVRDAIQYYERCDFPTEGSTLGTWVELEECGSVGASLCVDGGPTEGGGCINQGAEASCGDGQDNDGDGLTDCQDDDCVGLICNDGDACITGETCQADSSCATGTATDCDDQNECTADSCDPTDGSCMNDAATQEGEACGTGGICQSGSCLEQQCTVNADCPLGQFCGGGFCYVKVDQHGSTGLNQSGANGGPWPDGTPDNWDDDGDCYCESLPCHGSSNDACQDLFGGDCDDTPTGAANNPGAPDFPNDNFDNNCDSIVDG